MFRQILDRAEAGDQMGALVRGLKKEEMRRGMVLAKPGSVTAYNHFGAQVGWLFMPIADNTMVIDQLYVFSYQLLAC